MNSKILIAVLLICILPACEVGERESIKIEELASPAAIGSGEANLYRSPDGGIYLTWIETKSEGFAFYFSVFKNNAWSQPVKIAEGKDWFVNWADFPSLVKLDERTIVTHFLQKSGDSPYAYDIKIMISHDHGENWLPPFTPHQDETETEHGFVSLVPVNESEFMAIWLDGREYDGVGGMHGEGHEGEADMYLMAARINKEGQILKKEIVDPRICDCCQTSALMHEGKILTVYRNRTEDEIRDISLVTYEHGQWQEPVSVHDDGWRIHGCPVNGPAITANDDNTIAVAWFTNAGGNPLVKLAFSENSGATFSEPVIIDEGNPVGRVDVVMVNNSAYVSWMEQVGNDAEIRIRRVNTQGEISNYYTISQSTALRSSGFPKLAVVDQNTLLASWTQVSFDENRVKTALVHLRD